MKCIMKRLTALLLVAALLVGLAGCAGTSDTAWFDSGDTEVLGAAEEVIQPEVSTLSNTREDTEQAVRILNGTMTDEEIDQLSDDELNSLMNYLVQDSDGGNGGSTGFLAESDAFNEDGSYKEPFDQLAGDEFDELVNNGTVAYNEETILIKMDNSRNGSISDGMKEAGVAELRAIVPLEDATWYEAMLTEETDVKTAVAQLRGLPEIMLVDYNYEVQTAVLDQWQELSPDLQFDNNTQYTHQWHMHHCGIPDGMNQMKTNGGSSSVIVAVIDSGVDYDHEDLAQNIWVNRGETPDDGIDNDKNGYVDDYYGVNVVAGKGNGDDDNGHGTHVAGIIAAQNNNLGTVGIAYNVKIMPIKAATASGTLTQADVAEAVMYAYENGADVINMSFGGSAASIAEQDALAVAYTRSVLVASAGNSGRPNEPAESSMLPLPNYPAALTYVLGVMSVDQRGVESSFTNWDVEAFNGVEYELYAPGDQIMSTLPNDAYGKLSGTSMAAPVVSACAAVLRSEYSDRDTYPTRFIYGQLAATSGYSATCLDPEKHGRHNLAPVVDLYAALTKLPTPELGVSDFATFDTVGLANDTTRANNGDGVIDAGETIALGLTLRNRWGASENTKVTIDAITGLGVTDPYITIINPTVDYGAVGSYATGDCGAIYTDGVLTGWQAPFYVQISEDCPNDYRFTLNVTISCENGLDPEDSKTYTFDGITIDLFVRNGVIVPSIIDEDMTWTSDNLYIIPNSTVIEEGVTVRVEPGTHIQFWSNDATDPYADSYIAFLKVDGNFLVEGTKEDMVYIYPSELMANYIVKIYESGSGYVSLEHADITNLITVNADTIASYADSCVFRLNYAEPMRSRQMGSGMVSDTKLASGALGIFTLAKNCAFYKYACTGYSTYRVMGNFDTCAFIDCELNFGYSSSYGPAARCTNCVFLGNRYESTASDPNNSALVVFNPVFTEREAEKFSVFYREETGTTYAAVYNSEDAALTIEQMGGKPAVLENQAELDWFCENVAFSDSRSYEINFGIHYDRETDTYVWADGTAIGDFIDPDGLRYSDSNKLDLGLHYTYKTKTGNTLVNLGNTLDDIYYIYEFPGQIPPTEITFADYEVQLDMESTYQVVPLNKPVQLPADAFLYSSSNEAVLTVDETGLVTPVGNGTADIIVTSLDKAVSNYVTITVTDFVTLEGFSFTESAIELPVGEQVNLSLRTPVNTTRYPTFATTDATVAVVDAYGNITGIGSGTAEITAAYTVAVTDPETGEAVIDSETGEAVLEERTASLTVTVYQRATSLTIPVSSAMVSLAEETTVLPTVELSANAEADLQWTSSDPSVASVEDGALQLHAVGSTSLVVTDLRSGLSAEQVLYVSEDASPVVKIYTHNQRHYALTESGNLYYWSGYAAYLTPVCVLEHVIDFDGNNDTVFVLCNDGTLAEYEIHTSGGEPQLQETFLLPAGKTPVQVAYYSGNSANYAVLNADGTVYTWGDNQSGELGLGITGRVETPTLVNVDATFVDVEMGSVSAFLTETGEVYCAGGQYAGLVKVLDDATGIFKSDSNLFYISRSQYGEFYPRNPMSRDPADTKLLNAELLYLGSSRIVIGYDEGELFYGDAYNARYTSLPVETGISALYCYQETYWFADEQGLLYGVGNGHDNAFGNGVTSNVTVPVVVPVNVTTGEVLTVTGSNLNGNGILEGDTLTLTFNKHIDSAGGISLYADGAQMPFTASTQYNTVSLTRAAGFEPGVTYTVKLAADAFHGAVQSSLAEDMEITFTAASTATGEPEEGTEDTAPVIHTSTLDSSIERVWTAESFYEDLMAAQAEYQINPQFYNNAVLNRFVTDTDVNHWMRPTPSNLNGAEIALGGNWWGTTNPQMIELQMVDYRDNVTLGKLEYEPYLTTPPENTFPFVTDITVLNQDGDVIDSAGSEEITVRVTFNRDMDTSIPLDVRFGSAYPYADYQITDGAYVNARTWEGKYFVSTVIGNGAQYFTISNGCSATDDLDLYPDWGRFMFHIDISAAQALIMQGNATESGVQLTWTQDDFDTLMGYNVYRSTSEDGFYQRLNSTVIPADQMEFFDDTVEPGVLYYYNFTVVQTDLSESLPSGKITIRSMDTMAPNIYHSVVAKAFAGENLVVSATVTDNLSLSHAKVHYRTVGMDQWTTVTMSNVNDKYSAVIPGAEVTTAGIEYYIEAYDGITYTYKGSAEAPYTILVQETVNPNSLGDVNGDGKISNVDALMLLQAINDLLNLSAEQFNRADLNGDGELTASEALRIIQYVNGTIGSVVMP